MPDLTVSAAVDGFLTAADQPAMRVALALGNVNNTSDANKPVSTATQTALDAKAPINSPTFTGTVGGITKAMVGLGNVDNTSDATKNAAASTLTNKTINGATIVGGTISNATSVSDLNFLSVIDTLFADAGTQHVTIIDLGVGVGGTVHVLAVGGTFSLGNEAVSYDGTIVSFGVNVGLAGHDITGFANLSSELFYFLFNGTFSLGGIVTYDGTTLAFAAGAITGITQTTVGLGNVDNTSDANKPISDATQTALDGKANAGDPANSLQNGDAVLELNNASDGWYSNFTFQVTSSDGTTLLHELNNDTSFSLGNGTLFYANGVLGATADMDFGGFSLSDILNIQAANLTLTLDDGVVHSLLNDGTFSLGDGVLTYDGTTIQMPVQFNLGDGVFVFAGSSLYVGASVDLQGNDILNVNDLSFVGALTANGNLGVTEDVTIGIVTLHFVNGIYTGQS